MSITFVKVALRFHGWHPISGSGVWCLQYELTQNRWPLTNITVSWSARSFPVNDSMCSMVVCLCYSLFFMKCHWLLLLTRDIWSETNATVRIAVATLPGWPRFHIRRTHSFDRHYLYVRLFVRYTVNVIKSYWDQNLYYRLPTVWTKWLLVAQSASILP